jgi:hypothetical protein
MNLEGLPSALIVVLVCLVAAAGLWYLAIRFRQPRLKTFAVAIVVVPAVGFGFQFGSQLFGSFDSNPDFETTATGSVSLDGSMISEFPFPVNNPGFVHQIELKPRSSSGQTPTVSIPLHFILRTTKGDILAEKQAILAPGTDRYWLPLRTEFQPVEAGEYSLHLDVPRGVSYVKVRVHELRKR